MNEIVRLPTVPPLRHGAPSIEGADVAVQSREVIRLWNRMRAQERAFKAVRSATAQAELFAMRRQLQQALARRDRLIAAARAPAGPAE